MRLNETLSVILTQPAGCKLGGHRDEVLERWDDICREARVPFTVVEPIAGEIHGQLLERLWREAVYDALDGGGSVLVSEVDFVPERRHFRVLESLPETGLLLAPYSTRIYQPGSDVIQQPGTIALHSAPPLDGQGPRIPLVGAWFVLLRPGAWVRNVPLDWLGAAGPFNDAANHAYLELAKLPEKQRPPVLWLRPRDLHPLGHGIEYEGLGAHLFFARHADDPDDAVCCWPELPQPLTGRLIRRGYQRFLSGTFEAFARR